MFGNMRNFKNPIIFISGLLLFISAFSKFESQWVADPVSYPPIISSLVEYNRILVGITLFIGLALLLLKRKIISFPTPYIFIFSLHAFLSLKAIFYGGDAWIAGLLGILIILAASMIFSNSLLGTERDINIIFYSCLCWVATGIFLIATAGYEYYATNSRIYLFTSHPNHAGSIFAISAFLMLFMLTNKTNKNKIILAATGLVSTYFLICTGSRGSMLSLVFGVITLLYLKRSRLSLLLIATAIIAVPVLLLIDNEILFSFFSSQVDRGNTRSGTYGAALNDFLLSPLLGAPITGDRYIYVENTILASMQLGGVIGLLLILGFYGMAFYYFFKICSRKKERINNTTIFYASLFAVTFSQSMFESFPLNFIGGGTYLMIISIIGMRKTLPNKFSLRFKK